jgi:hypothetical protein
MRSVLLAIAFVGIGCDKEPAPGAGDAAGAAATPVIDAARPAATVIDAAPAAAPAAESMPPRPVPRSSPTVTSSMPAETQMRAIAYMSAMVQPHVDDAPADAKYAEALATQLKPIALSLDKGAADEKAKLNRVEVGSGGRKIDILLASGCDAQAPMRAVVTRANVTLSTLLAHGVLVVRCNDARVQCLQSTRDPTDVLCTTAPRHK